MAMRKYYYTLGRQMYEELGAGLVRVTNRDGKIGIFRCDGSWVEGDVRDANLHMLIFCGGPTIPPEFNYRWPEVPADPERSSGWTETLERGLEAAGQAVPSAGR